MIISKFLLAVGSVAVLSSAALAGPDWVEDADAGSTLGTAQPILVDSGSLRSISGSLTSGRDTPDFEDVYRLKIIKPSLFNLSLRGATFDTQLFVFRVISDGVTFAIGQLANDNADSTTIGSALGNFATDGTETTINTPGDYLIAISVKGRNPISDSGLIFNFETPTEVSGPDGPGGFNDFIGWQGQGSGGAYTLLLEGTGPFDVPAPGSIAAVAGALALTARRRR
jgi:hypothetical protein